MWTHLREQAGTFWGALPRAQRIGLVGGTAVIFILLGLLAVQMSPGGYVPLFTQLGPDDAGEIVAVLRERGIPYQLSEQGTAVLVPQESVYETRLDLASQGMPRGGIVGFEIFRDSPIGTTDFERMVRFQQALQGELTRTIRELHEVVDARVHIVLPERSLFIRDQRPATASVLLHLRSPLRPHQVSGIAHLVASSVESLHPENVTILDSRGQILSDSVRMEAAQGGPIDLAARFEWQRAYERELEYSVQSMLERVFGVDRVVARVRAELNFDLLEERQELFEPVVGDRGILRSQQTLDESYQGGPARVEAAGVPGVETNIPGYVATDGIDSSGNRFEQISNFELNRTERVRVTTPGAIEGLSVAVWVDRELEEAERQRVEDTVVSALGLDLGRGDMVTVEALAFERETPVAALTAAPADEDRFGPWLWALLAVGVGVLLITVFRRSAPTPATSSVDVQVNDEEIEEPRVSQEELTKRRQQEAIEQMAKDKPEDVARLLRGWLAEDER